MCVINRIVSALLCAVLIVGLCAVCPLVATAASGDEFFRDSVFLGDSLTVGLQEYTANMRSTTDASFLSNAKFLAKVGYPVNSTDHIDSSSVHPAYNGVRQQPQKSIAAMGVKKVFIMLGTNDVQEDFDDTVTAYTALVKAIRGACPGITVYVQSVMPMCKSREFGKMTNARIELLNTKLRAMCTSLSVTYIDVTGNLKDNAGTLKTRCSSDGYVHLNADGYAAWVSALRNAVSNIKEGYRATVTGSNVNLRSKPTTKSQCLAVLPKGASIGILEPYAQNNWHKVQYAGSVGYISGDYVQFDSAGMDMVTAKIVNVSSFVNSRSGPGTEFEIPFTIRKGAVVLVATAYLADSWCLVYYNSNYVFVRKDFIQLV